MTHQCLSCQGPLEKGFMVDRGDYEMKRQAQWASGDPVTSFWRCSVLGSDEREVPVVTWRCTRCGRLEFFAPTATA